MIKELLPHNTTAPRPVILGTDWWTDCDDAVAIRILLRAQKEGIIDIKAIGINACMRYSLRSLKEFISVEGYPSIPIGIDNKATDYGGKPRYQRGLAIRNMLKLRRAESVDAVALYRKALQETQGQVDIIEIGYPQVLADLLKSKPDKYSALDGCELVTAKVNKLWCMGGNWENPESGKENNFARNKRASEAASYLLANFPKEITLLGWETGATVISGQNLHKNDILHKLMARHGSAEGRSSWDPMLALLAVVGEEKTAGYDAVRGIAKVDAATGENSFVLDSSGKHTVVKKLYDDKNYEDIINRIIG